MKRNTIVEIIGIVIVAITCILLTIIDNMNHHLSFIIGMFAIGWLLRDIVQSFKV
jgi:hypothetical protein